MLSNAVRMGTLPVVDDGTPRDGAVATPMDMPTIVLSSEESTTSCGSASGRLSGLQWPGAESAAPDTGTLWAPGATHMVISPSPLK